MNGNYFITLDSLNMRIRSIARLPTLKLLSAASHNLSAYWINKQSFYLPTYIGREKVELAYIILDVYEDFVICTKLGYDDGINFQEIC